LPMYVPLRGFEAFMRVSRISNAYSLRRGRRRPPTLEVKELQFVIVIVIVKPLHCGGKLF
jgi:hypothetical protein